LSRKVLIALTGVDGVGKSTHATLLYEKLRAKFKIGIIHDEFPQLVVRIITGVGQRYENKKSIVANESAKVVSFSLRNLLHLLLYAFNEILMLFCILNDLKKSNVIILDRWFPDSLASVTYNKMAYMSLVKNIFLALCKASGFVIKLSNTITFIVLLKADPSVTWTRRPEHSLLRQKMVSNLIDYFVRIAVEKNHWSLVTINTTDMSILKTHASILKALGRMLSTVL
jgi:thymidylate kinase